MLRILLAALVSLLLAASPASAQAAPALNVHVEPPEQPIGSGTEGTLTLTVERRCANMVQILPATTLRVAFTTPAGVEISGPADLALGQHVCATEGGGEVSGTYAITLEGVEPAIVLRVGFEVSDAGDHIEPVQEPAPPYEGEFVVASADDPEAPVAEDPRAAGVEAANDEAAAPVETEDAPGAPALLLIPLALAIVALRRRKA